MIRRRSLITGGLAAAIYAGLPKSAEALLGSSQLLGFGVGGLVKTLVPTSGDWAGQTGSYTISSGTLDKNATDDNGVYLSATDFVGNFDITWTPNNGTSIQSNQYWGGFYPVSEHGTLNLTIDTSALGSMTNSFWIDGESVGHTGYDINYGGSTVATPTADASQVVRMTRVGSTIAVYINGSLSHTYATTYAGTMRFTISARSSAITYSSISVTYDA